jgi:hypothetical protein
MYRRFICVSCFAFVLTAVAFGGLSLTGATAGLLREVRVTVHNSTHRMFKVEMYESQHRAFRVVWHRRVSKELEPGHSLQAESGAFDDQTIVITTSQCKGHPYGIHALNFKNPFIGYPEVTETLEKVEDDGHAVWRPVERGMQPFRQGETLTTWNGQST